MRLDFGGSARQRLRKLTDDSIGVLKNNISFMEADITAVMDYLKYVQDIWRLA